MNGESEVATPIPPRGGASTAKQRIASMLEIVWMLLLILPAASTMSASRPWDLNAQALFIVSCWLFIGARLLYPRRGFFLATLPIMLLGLLCVGADFLRVVDLLELLLQWRTFPPEEAASAIRPYIGLAAAGFAVVGALCWAAWHTSSNRSTGRLAQLGVLAGTVALACAVPAATWVRSWPTDGVLVVASTVADSRALSQYLFPATSSVDPRDPKATWNASRVAGAPADETVVFIIGETVRNDFLKECHGPDRVRAVAAGALVACDVTSGADSTAASVPLLVSREMPGHPVRVSSDATFAHALKEAGFETHWFGVQGSTVAWADADDQRFPITKGTDAALLVPPLAAALATPARLKAIVLHASNAHDPYSARYDPATAPYQVPAHLGEALARTNLQDVRLTYANAVDASVGFINGVIRQLEQHPEPVFLIFSPDHGENLLDDNRELWGHELRHPTQWDTHVPAIFWANDAWRATHAAQWANLKSQIDAPLMHIDLVPTLLDAAGVRYEDRRAMRVDLLAQTVPTRRRVVQESLGSTIEWETLVNEARAAGPLTH